MRPSASGLAMERIRCLVVEDSEPDFILLSRRLRADGMEPECLRVARRDDLERAVSEDRWDVVLSDYYVPGMTFQEGLELVRSRLPDVPVILVSGSIGEEQAVESLKMGVSDFVLKDRLTKLAPSIRRSLREAEDRKARRVAETALRESEERHRLALDAAALGTWRIDLATRHAVMDAFCARHLDFETLTADLADLRGRVHPQDVAHFDGMCAAPGPGEDRPRRLGVELRIVCRDGSLRWISFLAATHMEVTGDSRRPTAIVGITQDITERKSSERSREEQLRLQDQLARIAATVPGMIYQFQRWPDGRTAMPFTSTNSEDIFGADFTLLKDDASGLLELIHPDDVAAFNTSINLSASTLTPWRQEFRYRHPVRGEVWVEGHSVPQSVPDGSTLWHGFAQDITERKQAEFDLRERGERLDLALSAAHMGVWEWDIASDALFWSDRCYAIMGIDSFGGRMEHFRAMMHPEDMLDVWNRIEDAIATGTRMHAEFRAIVPGGLPKWVATSAFARYDGSGNPLRVVGTLQDVDEARRARAELEAHKADLERLIAARTAELEQQASYLYALIDNFPFRVWLKDTGRRYLAANRAAAEQAGISVAEIIGKTDLELGLWPPDVAERYLADEAEVIATRSRKTREELLQGDAEPIWIETYQAPVVDHEGQVLGTVGFARDITERKTGEVAREAALAEANRLARMRSDFLANMSHEIRTPLNAILGFTQVGLRDNVGRHTAETFGRIQDSGQLLLGLVNDILDFSKIEAGKLDLEQAPFDLATVIDRAVALTAESAYAKGLTFGVTEAPDLPSIVRGDALRVSQVLVNLLTNAVKFTSEGHVALSVRTVPGALEFSVMDTGIGMTKEQTERLFRPFEQADSSTTRRFGGTGLGLAISNRLVAAMKGDISVWSETQTGTRFDVRLPLEVISGPAAAENVTLALVGLPQEELEFLVPALESRGATVVVTDVAAAFDRESDLLAIDASTIDAELAAWLARQIQQGRRIAVVSGHGRHTEVPEPLRSRAAPLERPLRARHFLAARRWSDESVTSQHITNRLAGLRLMVAEDNEVNRLVLEEMLAGEGVKLALAENGREALDILKAAGPRAFDVVVTDIQMPEMDGYRFARAALEVAPGLPIIGLTANAMPGERERCLAAGMVEQLVKPVDLETLVEALSRHARRTVRPAAPTSTASAERPEPALRTPFPAEAEPASGAGTEEDHTGTVPAIDWPALEAHFKGRREFVDRLVSTVLKTHETTPQKLRTAGQDGDLEAMGFIAHSLKGMAGNMKASALQAMAREAESAARSQDPLSATLAENLAICLEAALQAMRKRGESTG